MQSKSAGSFPESDGPSCLEDIITPAVMDFDCSVKVALQCQE